MVRPPSSPPLARLTPGQLVNDSFVEQLLLLACPPARKGAKPGQRGSQAATGKFAAEVGRVLVAAAHDEAAANLLLQCGGCDVAYALARSFKRIEGA